MRTLLIFGSLAFVLVMATGPAFAVFHPAPAPMIGVGIPVALVVGGALLVAKFVKRRK